MSFATGGCYAAKTSNGTERQGGCVLPASLDQIQSEMNFLCCTVRRILWGSYMELGVTISEVALICFVPQAETFWQYWHPLKVYKQRPSVQSCCCWDALAITTRSVINHASSVQPRHSGELGLEPAALSAHGCAALVLPKHAVGYRFWGASGYF